MEIVGSFFFKKKNTSVTLLVRIYKMKYKIWHFEAKDVYLIN